MIRRILLSIVAVCAMAAAAAIVVVAAAFALYAFLEVSLGRAGAAAVVALVFAVLAALIALVVGLQAKGGGRRRPPPEPSLTERLGQMARERPILAAGGALAAGLLALKNPQVVAGIVSAFLAAKAGDKAGRNRR